MTDDSSPKASKAADSATPKTVDEIKAMIAAKSGANAQVASPQIPSLNFQESSALFKKAFELLIKVEPQLLNVDDIKNDFAKTKRKHSQKSGGPVEVMLEQVREVGFINPVIVLRDKNPRLKYQYILLTGAKRLKVAEKAGGTIWCRVLERDELFDPATAPAWVDENQEALLKELAKNLTYSESALVTKIGDSSLLDLFCQMRTNYGYKKHEFSRVMPRIGITRENKEYRNCKRIWDVVCCEPALKLIEEKRVKLNLLKRDQNLRPLEQPNKAERIMARIIKYTDQLRDKALEKDRNKAFTQLKSYSDFEIEKIISEEDMPGRTSQGSLQDGYRQPRFEVRSDEKRIRIPAATLDFTDLDQPNNVRKIVETLYNLHHVVEQLEAVLRTAKPKAAGSPLNPHSVKPSPTPAPYRESYLQFIDTRNLHAYCNLEKIVAHFSSKGDPLTKSNRISDLKSNPDAIVTEFVQRMNERRTIKKEEIIHSRKIVDIWARSRSEIVREHLQQAAGSDVSPTSIVSTPVSAEQIEVRTESIQHPVDDLSVKPGLSNDPEET